MIPGVWKAGAAAAVVVVAWAHGGYFWSAKARAEFAEYKTKAEVLAGVAKAESELTERINRARKERADEENTRTIADLRRTVDRLRNNRASGGYVPPAPAGTRDPETACFNRSQLERAIERLDAGVSGIVEKGDEARVNLDTARRWAE